eukprot:CAMPEP_0174355252 /NCGR_PEP_ID=MMETSP0811_2-20130205/23560_1 /TAXON_ID=73025 ORGANISM="Eutreptiella gymnastica-like, Strain CCMP1594" /NCGR_SAMPLE_ID=MMETSP0811_2 /ASSEMBLY_ACC=CAM_ASM_000667 /LENGTH=149 /DNA_ID=CAMNT_0015486505 /DNA_START=70 /DNA_END=518 /DNA_ORIENTATION=+
MLRTAAHHPRDSLLHTKIVCFVHPLQQEYPPLLRYALAAGDTNLPFGRTPYTLSLGPEKDATSSNAWSQTASQGQGGVSEGEVALRTCGRPPALKVRLGRTAPQPPFSLPLKTAVVRRVPPQKHVRQAPRRAMTSAGNTLKPVWNAPGP